MSWRSRSEGSIVKQMDGSGDRRDA